MLIGIHPLLAPDLLQALAAMGHGDELALVDANFPAVALGRRVVEVRGAGAATPSMRSLPCFRSTRAPCRPR